MIIEFTHQSKLTGTITANGNSTHFWLDDFGYRFWDLSKLGIGLDEASKAIEAH